MVRAAGKLFLACCVACVFAWGRGDAHSLQEAYARVAERAYPAVAVVVKCQYTGGRLAPTGTGSGFFIRRDGLLVTNHHVIEGADAVGVRLLDGRLLNARVLGSNAAADLALLQVEVKSSVAFLTFGDTATVKVGHAAIAIGAPLSLSHTMTTGVISFKGRRLPGRDPMVFLQTDASVNPGNSGGPLLNLDGQVIGVNTCILSRGQSSIGLNFAIDGNQVQKVVAYLLREASSPKRPSVGLTVEETRPAGRGALVTRVFPRSAAQRAGLCEGDVIVQVDATPIPGIAEFQERILKHYRPGDTAVLVVRRGNARRRITITFGEAK